MAFDPEHHEIDPKTGFQVHKDGGHIWGLMQAPAKSHPDVGAEFPKWVAVHVDHIVKKMVGDVVAHISTPLFPHFHVDRNTHEVTVLVHNEDEEKMAISAPVVAEKPEEKMAISAPVVAEKPEEKMAISAPVVAEKPEERSEEKPRKVPSLPDAPGKK